MSINIATLAPFAPCVINIRGKVAYSHVSKFMEGAELERANQRRAANGLTIDTKPYTAVNIEDAYIVDDGTVNAQVKAYFEDKLKTRTRADGTMTRIYYAKSKSPFLPTIAYGKEAGNLAGQGIADNNVPLQNELANGLDITIGVKLFKTKSNMGVPVGVGVDYILVNEPIRYYVAPGIGVALASQGLTYTPPSENNAEGQTAGTAAAPSPMVSMNTADTTPIPVTPMQSVQQTQAQPMQQNVQQGQPVQQAQPLPMQSVPQQAQAQASPMVSYPQGGANYGAQTQPVQSQPVQEQAGQQAAPPTLQYTPN